MVAVALVSQVSHYIFGTLMFLTALFLILLILVQRGRGGGLSGAFGGLGGQSAFGTRAGDTFTYITIWASAVWIVLCIAAVKVMSSPSGKLDAGQAPLDRPAATAPLEGGGPAGTVPAREKGGSPLKSGGGTSGQATNRSVPEEGPATDSPSGNKPNGGG